MRSTDAVSTRRSGELLALLTAIRPRHWIKNLLVFVPALAAHRFDSDTILASAIVFATFCLVASAGYLLNDLSDAAHDRTHNWKHARPIARGMISPSVALVVAVVLGGAGLTIAIASLPLMTAGVLVVYLATTAAYSVILRAVAGVDLVTLAAAHILRIAAGGVATGITLSNWLLGFALLAFVTLALVKRIAELACAKSDGEQSDHGRPYSKDDIDMLVRFSLVLSCAAAIVLAAYAANLGDAGLYRHPVLIWLLCPVFLLWMLRALSIAHAGQIRGDPLVRLSGDKVTLATAGLVLGIVFAASL